MKTVFSFRKNVVFISILSAVVFSCVVFVPLFGFGGALSGHLFRGDAAEFWIPQLNILGFFLKHHAFTGIDYFTHNGSAEWFLRANLTAYFPPYVIAAFFGTSSDPRNLSLVITAIELITAFASLVYATLLTNRFLRLSITLSIFVAVGYTFSWYYLVQISYVPFSFIAWLTPGVAYYCLSSAYRPSIWNITAGAFLTFCCLTAGYLPMSFQGLSIAGVLVAYLLISDRATWPNNWHFLRAGLLAISPVAIAGLVTSPWMLAITQYAKLTISPSFSNNIQYSALDLSESPQALARLISGNFNTPGPTFEFSPQIGILYFSIFLLYIFAARNPLQLAISKFESRTVLFTGATYLFLLLIIYGQFTALTAVFFYFFPVASFSHLYQRYLPLAQIFLVLSSAIMLKAIIASEQSRVERYLLVAALISSLVLSLGVAYGLNSGVVGYNQELIIEFIYLAAFFATLIFARGNAVVWVAMLAAFLPALDRGYIPVIEPSMRYEARQAEFLPFSEPAIQAFDSQLATFRGSKQILKVVDTTPGVHGYVPENYPWFRAQDTLMSWYSGYEWHVGVPLEYRARNITNVGVDGQLRFFPDPAWVAATGADVLLYDPNDKEISPALLAMIDPSRPSLPFTYRDGTYIMAPLVQTYLGEPVTSDNGFFRLVGGAGTINEFSANYAGHFKFTVDAAAQTTLKYDFWPNQHLQFLINGVDVPPMVDKNGLYSVEIPGGKTGVEVRYSNNLLTMFIAFYACFIIGLAAIWLWLIARVILAFTRRTKAARSPAS